MLENKCKKCRRAGEKLFIKGEKCYTPKCPVIRKPYAPGSSGQGKGRGKKPRGMSEYGTRLREKQKIKFSYGLREKQFSNYVKESNKQSKGNAEVRLFEFLESRLDNVVFRSGLAGSRLGAKQIVSHGHIVVNNRKVDIPSYRVKIGDKVSIRPQSTDKNIFKDIDIKLKKYNAPSWINLDKTKKESEVIGRPTI